jgi:hypothetical protein
MKMRELANLIKELKTATIKKMIADLELNNLSGRDDHSLLVSELQYRNCTVANRYNVV